MPRVFKYRILDTILDEAYHTVVVPRFSLFNLIWVVLLIAGATAGVSEGFYRFAWKGAVIGGFVGILVGGGVGWVCAAIPWPLLRWLMRRGWFLDPDYAASQRRAATNDKKT